MRELAGDRDDEACDATGDCCRLKGFCRWSLDGMLLADVATHAIIACNDAVERLLGYRTSDLVGKPCGKLFAPVGDPGVQDSAALSGNLLDGVFLSKPFLTASGTLKYLDMTINPVNARGRAVFFITLRDATERVDAERKIAHLSVHDLLTDLPNRLLLFDRLAQAIHSVARAGGFVGVLFLDLDRFKRANDTHGHKVGDCVLIAVAHRLRGIVRATDTVARVGGDEFVVVLPDMQAARDAQDIAAKIASAVAAPIHVGDITSEVGASIGIAIHPGDGDDADSLIRVADSRMYAQKRARHGQAL